MLVNTRLAAFFSPRDTADNERPIIYSVIGGNLHTAGGCVLSGVDTVFQLADSPGRPLRDDLRAAKRPEDHYLNNPARGCSELTTF